MTTSVAWPDRATYAAVVLDPVNYFDDPDLHVATFTRCRSGSPMVWSGGRAIVFRAERPSGELSAIRFLIAPDREAGTRYEMLGRHLLTHPVESIVRARWAEHGLCIAGNRFPMMTMEWIDGVPLDRHIDQCIAAPTASADLRVLSEGWRRSCQLLDAASIGHGDVHAGNIMVCSHPGQRPEIRLVDYDNVWVPGLHLPCREAGHPAFQHPTRQPMQHGPYVDALPNTLTYLSLVALAGEPTLWQFHDGLDDALLFERRDLEAPTTRDIWSALRGHPDALVRSIAGLTASWLASAPDSYHTLDEVIRAAARGLASATDRKGLNVWPQPKTSDAGPHTVWRGLRPSAGTRPSIAAAAGQPDSLSSSATQTWPGVPGDPPSVPDAVTSPPGGHRLVWLIILLAVLIALVAGAGIAIL